MASIISHKRVMIKPASLDLNLNLNIEKTCYEDATCPICLDHPHNTVLLRCTSYEKGCRPFICDTDQTRSNCLERFKSAYGVPPASAKVQLDTIHIIPPNQNDKPTCPLCRGDVIGWIVIEEARSHLNSKKRCCEESNCVFSGNYMELQKHTQTKHPNARPSEIDPARRLDWENFQQSSDIIDVLSTIHSQVPNGVVLGDYVIEYGDDETGDEYEVFHRVRGRWWSCILCKAFCRARRRGGGRRRNGSTSHRSNPESSNIEVNSARSVVDIREYRFDDVEDEFVRSGTVPRRFNSIYRFLNFRKFLLSCCFKRLKFR